MTDQNDRVFGIVVDDVCMSIVGGDTWEEGGGGRGLGNVRTVMRAQRWTTTQRDNETQREKDGDDRQGSKETQAAQATPTKPKDALA